MLTRLLMLAAAALGFASIETDIEWTGWLALWFCTLSATIMWNAGPSGREMDELSLAEINSLFVYWSALTTYNVWLLHFCIDQTNQGASPVLVLVALLSSVGFVVLLRWTRAKLAAALE